MIQTWWTSKNGIKNWDASKKDRVLNFWFDCKGVVCYEMLPNKQMINSDVYCQQLMQYEEEIK